MIARIIMSEHPNEKDLEHFSSDHKDAVKDGFLANTQFSISVQTSPTSLLVISGYEDQKSADSNLEARQKWFDERKGKYLDTFYYEGEIKTQMKGGGKQLLSDQTEVNTDTEVVPTNMINKDRDMRLAKTTTNNNRPEWNNIFVVWSCSIIYALIYIQLITTMDIAAKINSDPIM